MKYCPKCGRRVQNSDVVANIPVPTEDIPVVEPSFAETVYQTESAQQILDNKNDQVQSSTPYKSQAPNVLDREPKAAKKSRFPLIVIGIAIILAGIFFVIWSGNRKDISLADCAENVLYLELYDSSGSCIGSGSGFLINDETTLVTNYHVIEDAYRMIAITADGDRTVEVDTVLAYDKDADLAILKCGEKIGIAPLTLADSDQVKQGDTVYAAGYPLGIANTLSNGIISSRYIDEYGVDVLQITAPISNGSSGGAVLNEQGMVVGVICAYYEFGQNLNLAVASNVVAEMLEEMDGSVSLEALYWETHSDREEDPAVDTEAVPQMPDETKTPETAPEAEAGPAPESGIFVPVVCSHQYGVWKIVAEADCTTQGEEARTCSKCGEEQTRTTQALGHDWAAATCTEPETCTRCKEHGAKQALGHVWLKDEKKGLLCRTCGRIGTSEEALLLSATEVFITDPMADLPMVEVKSVLVYVSTEVKYDETKVEAWWHKVNKDNNSYGAWTNLLGIRPIENGTYTITVYIEEFPQYSRDITVHVNLPSSIVPVFDEEDLAGTWTYGNVGSKNFYYLYRFSGRNFYWEQRPGGEDSPVQTQEGTFEIDGRFLCLYPSYYKEDGVSIDWLMDPRKYYIEELTDSTLVFERQTLTKQR